MKITVFTEFLFIWINRFRFHVPRFILYCAISSPFDQWFFVLIQIILSIKNKIKLKAWPIQIFIKLNFDSKDHQLFFYEFRNDFWIQFHADWNNFWLISRLFLFDFAQFGIGERWNINELDVSQRISLSHPHREHSRTSSIV